MKLLLKQLLQFVLEPGYNLNPLQAVKVEDGYAIGCDGVVMWWVWIGANDNTVISRKDLDQIVEDHNLDINDHVHLWVEGGKAEVCLNGKSVEVQRYTDDIGTPIRYPDLKTRIEPPKATVWVDPAYLEKICAAFRRYGFNRVQIRVAGERDPVVMEDEDTNVRFAYMPMIPPGAAQ